MCRLSFCCRCTRWWQQSLQTDCSDQPGKRILGWRQQSLGTQCLGNLHGEILPDGSKNPMPRRNLPWMVGDPYARASLDSDKGVADVGSHPGDVSPYGVLDLAGNAQEWTESRGLGVGTRLVRGAGIASDEASLVDFMAIENPRPESSGGSFEIGMRCAINDGHRVARDRR